jgi:small subunit ribosomal protein S12
MISVTRMYKLLKLKPQIKSVTLKLLTISPKKPNSANRRVVRCKSFSSKNLIVAYVPGEGHNLQQHATILVQHDRLRDLIGVKHATVRGKYDLLGVSGRITSRSLYGVKKVR